MNHTHRGPRVIAAVAVAAVVASGVGTIALSGTPAQVVPLRTGTAQAPAAATGTATEQQQTGVVDVDTVLGYGAGRAAGTGIVLSPDGRILTNNHVVQDSTSIAVTVVSTGERYTASVVGTDATDDVAVLQLRDASGLTPAVLATADQQAAVAPGTAVTAVGNAGGKGGTPSAVDGTVTALGQTITAADENGENPERLTGLIEVSAPIEAGDSGGPLYAGDAVIGIDTAGSQSGAPSLRNADRTETSAPVTGYAIPIGNALGVADRITSGERSATIAQGYPAFLGIQLARGANGLRVAGIVPGSPADSAGLTAGDVIVSVGGRSVGDGDQLSSALDAHGVGDQVRIGWEDSSGTDHAATVTLAAGPAR